MAGSTTFADQLGPTTDPNTSDPVTFVATGGDTTDFLVQPSGAISVTDGPLAAGPYTVSGTDEDSSLTDNGTWSYTLTVDPLEVAPSAGTATTATASAFTDQIEPTNNGGSAVTYVTSVTNTKLTVSSSGAVATASGPLAAGPYSVSGTDADTLGDTGTWSYTLTVSGLGITQAAPLTAVATVAASTLFSDQLEPTTNAGTAVTYVTTVTNPKLTVSPTGAVATVNGPLAAGPYTVSGTDSDTLGDSGTWGFMLTVGGNSITQTAPLTDVTTVTTSTLFSDQLEPTTNAGGAVTYVTTAPSASLSVSSSGVVTPVGAPLAAGPYTVSGTDSDTLGDTGTWSFTLTVSSSNSPPPPPVTLKQAAPTTGTTTTTASATFQDGPLTVSNGTGTITFVTTSTSPGVSVSAIGDLTTSGALTVGTYSVSGTDSDPANGSGTWTYTLTVVNPSYTVTFEANGGLGTMATESKNTATALSPNVYTWAKHAFTEWNTAADGSGTSYANGQTYGFAAPITLYAQWVVTTHPAIKHLVTFNANGGTGATPAQTNSVLATLNANGFTRTGYVFKGWNTAAAGSGTAYAGGAAYSFAKSITLYAQWRAKNFKVTFDANGGTGSMAPVAKRAPAHLPPNAFARTGYKFFKWSTSANGSGNSYANDALFAFNRSMTLYAQWTAKKVVVPPAVHTVVTLAPFTNKSALLSPALESQITALAALVKVDHDTKIALVGFSGDLTTANELNEEAWSASLKLAIDRAKAVESYLTQQLSALGLTGYVITTSGSTKAIVVSSASEPQNRKVVASLT